MTVVFAIDRAGLVGADGATHKAASISVPAVSPEHGR